MTKFGIMLGLLLSLGLVGHAFSQAVESQKFPAAQVTKVKIKKNAGNIEIKVATGNEVWIEKAGPHCQTTIYLDRTTLKVEEIDANGGQNCREPLRAFVPAYAKVDIEGGSGNVIADNFPGPLEFELSAGNVTCNACTGKVDADVGRGNIRLTDFGGTADLDIKMGNIDVQMAKTMASGARLDLESSVGNIKVAVPASVDVLAVTKTFIGKVKNDFGPVTNKLPLLSIEAEAKVGSIEINKVTL